MMRALLTAALIGFFGAQQACAREVSDDEKVPFAALAAGYHQVHPSFANTTFKRSETKSLD